MRNLLLSIILLCFVCIACQQPKKEFKISGKYQDIKLNATVLLKNANDSNLCSENFKDGIISLKGNLEKEGFYTFFIQFDDKKRTENKFTIWLSEDSLAIDFEDKLGSYPKITSNNKIQQGLSQFYQIKREVSHEARKHLEQAKEDEETKGAKLQGDAYSQLLYNIDDAKEKVDNSYFVAIQKFVESKPAPIALFKIIEESPENQYAKHPDEYLAILKSIAPDLKTNSDYQDLMEKLDGISKVAIGKKIELKIFGNDLNGKPFSTESLKGKRIIFLEFWKSSNVVGRTYRPGFKKTYDEFKDKGFEIIGISLDKKEDWWRTAVKDDKVTWPQFSDLKGNDSPNIGYYNIQTIPKNILIDDTGKILEIDLPAQSLALELDKYIK